MLAIPSAPMTLCRALSELTVATWTEMGAGISSFQRLAEESITDYNLMRLAAAVPAVIVEKHNKRREAETGADWELWVGRPGSYIGCRIQAKILTPEGARYEALYGTKGNATQQANDLITSALAGRPSTYPLYSFYNHRLPSGTGPTVAACPASGRRAPNYGWTVASALRVADVLRSNPTKSAAAFDSLAVPIPCLFCCPDSCQKASSAGTSLAEQVADRLQTLFASQTRDNLPDLVHEVAPVYVERMFKGERPDDGWREASLPTPAARFLPDDLARVVLIRETEVA